MLKYFMWGKQSDPEKHTEEAVVSFYLNCIQGSIQIVCMHVCAKIKNKK